MIDAPYRGPWPDVRPLVHRELAAYLDRAADPATHDLRTRCPPWTVHDVTAHLAATFQRFNRLLARGRTGDLRPPFARAELSDRNLAAVREFRDTPLLALDEQASAFVAATEDLEEAMPHQRGPIPVGLQLLFGLDELAIHHDDIAAAAGGAYRPHPDVVAVLTDMWQRALGGVPDDDDPWIAILRASGRSTPER